MICIYKKSLQSTFDINFSLIHVYVVPIFGRQNLVPDFGSGFRALVPGFIPSQGIKPGTNARNPEPKSGTKFCQQNIAVKHACIELKFRSNVDYRLFFDMHISIFLHLSLYYMQVKYRTMSWNTKGMVSCKYLPPFQEE